MKANSISAPVCRFPNYRETVEEKLDEIGFI